MNQDRKHDQPVEQAIAAGQVRVPREGQSLLDFAGATSGVDDDVVQDTLREMAQDEDH